METYLHTTNEDRVKSILDRGLYVSEYLRNTTDVVGENDFSFWVNYRKAYGKFCIVIQIDKVVMRDDLYKKELSNEDLEYIKKETDDDNFEDCHFEFLVPSRFMKGYFKLDTMEFFANPNFNPYKS